MAADEQLATYLNDHLAGAMGAVDLAEKSAEKNSGIALGTFLSGLKTAIEEDRVTLVMVMERLGVEQATIKQASGRIVEKLSRLRLHEKVTGDPVLSRLMELETLHMGVTGKLSLWRTLQEVARRDSRLAGVDLEALIQRAQSQIAEITEQHQEVARAFAT